MLAWLLPWLDRPAGLTGTTAGQDVISRAALAASASFLLAVLCGRALIGWLRERFREPIKSASPQLDRLHAGKAATPTMGGLFIVAAIVCSTLLFADLNNRLVLLSLFVTVALATLGTLDDLTKLRTARRGLGARTKLFVQAGIATIAALAVYVQAESPADLALHVPCGLGHLPLGVLFVPLAALVIVGSSNAVNLSDGLDGLAGGCLVFATGAMAALCYVGGDTALAAWLNVPHVAGCGEMLVVAAGTLGAVLGFLWFNCHPASVFMGDTGSLPLGGLLGFLAIACRQELLFVLIAGVFVVEAISVVLQVGSCKLTGRRVLRCAPLHHHFQFGGWPENKIVVRFWIASALCAAAGLALVRWNAEQPGTFKALHSPIAREIGERP